MKTCNKCKEEKELSYFCTDNSKKDKKFSWCKECNKAHKRTPKSKEVQAKYKKQRGYRVHMCNGLFIAIHNSHTLGRYKTKEAAEQVLAKHKKRQIMRAIEIQNEFHDDYYDTL